MTDDKPKSSEELIPQADQQAHADMAERAGQEGAQAEVINKKEAEKRKPNKNK